MIRQIIQHQRVIERKMTSYLGVSQQPNIKSFSLRRLIGEARGKPECLVLMATIFIITKVKVIVNKKRKKVHSLVVSYKRRFLALRERPDL